MFGIFHVVVKIEILLYYFIFMNHILLSYFSWLHNVYQSSGRNGLISFCFDLWGGGEWKIGRYRLVVYKRIFFKKFTWQPPFNHGGLDGGGFF